MNGRFSSCWWAPLASAGALCCGAEASSTLIVGEQTDERIAGHFASDGRSMEFSSVSSAPLAGDVQLRVGALEYDLHYDYEAREVRVDGHGGAIDRAAQGLLLGAIDASTRYLAPSEVGTPLHEQMLAAAFSLLRDSGGMPLSSTTFELGPKPTRASASGKLEKSVEDKSLEDDGVSCIQSGSSYYVSFDYGEATVIDGEIEAGSQGCNGQCGPYCTALTPWRMWTLDCLEHDTCCRVTDDNGCWTPLGECGDEYEAAMTDFLRGYEPFRKHCGG